MPRTRPAYPPEFRRQIVELVRAGPSPEELAKEFEPSAQTIRTWTSQDRVDSGERPGLTSDEKEETPPRPRPSQRQGLPIHQPDVRSAMRRGRDPALASTTPGAAIRRTASSAQPPRTSSRHENTT
ncbi:transposase [Streptomyces sp. NPDC088124]|uniref:transposase n=1 Tax=Streptomyces sp. NPDC088124 TaxID=3154654 RepID=UPI00343E3255